MTPTKQFNFIKPICNTIPEYFTGKDIFVTGFSGFFGKFLIYKLLTDCENVGKLYVLIRPNKTTLEEKMKKTIINPIFDKLREKNPSFYEKIIPIEGDLSKIDLGISEENRRTLISNVSVVFHMAASVRFDLPLKEAILLNVRGTRDLCNLVLSMNRCEVFAHVSTAYCCHLRDHVIEERLYLPPGNWRECIEIAENFDKFDFNILSKKYTEGYPNTYTFTKALAESVVADLCTNTLSTLIFRPTIVYSAYKEPEKGWIGNLNGPGGLFVGQFKGLTRIALGGENVILDLIPIDYVINTLVKATWIQPNLSPSTISVYNCSSSNYFKLSQSTLVNISKKVLETVPPNPLWHIELTLTDNFLFYYLNVFFFHLIPMIAVDFGLKVVGKPPMFAKLQRILYNSTMMMYYFNSNTWIFCNNNCDALDLYLKDCDKNAFYSSLLDIDIIEYFENSMTYILKNILKENLSDSNRTKRKILFYVHNGIKYLSMFLIFWYLWNNFVLPALSI